MDLILINPDSSVETYQGLAQEYSAIEPPVWALLIAGALRDEFEVCILDPLPERISDAQAVMQVYESGARLVCFVIYGSQPNSGTMNMAGACRLAAAIKKQVNVPIAFIGSHPSALPDETLKLPFVDYVLPGDGVQALRKLLRHDLREVPEQVIWGKPTPTSEFKTYPWELIPPLTRYRAHTWHANFGPDRSPFAAIFSSIGCVFKCNFCMINSINREAPEQLDASFSTGMRFFSPDWVLNELEILAKKGVRNVRLSDEMFFLNRSHYVPIVRGLAERDYGLNLWAYARVDSVRPEHLDSFKRAGINWLCLGIESGNASVRREVTKGRYENVSIRKVASEIKAAGINLLANFILGLPEDSQESMEQTLELALEICAEHSNFYPCLALPGSPLGRRAASQPNAIPKTWSGYSFHSRDCQPLPTKHLTAAEILRFRDYAWERATLDEAHLALVRERFGRHAVEQLQAQAQIKLERKLLET